MYLAVVIDRYSRKADRLGLDRTLAARMAVTALQQAIAERQPPPGVVHHSDQGIQYACAEFQGVVQAHQMVPSMSRPANPYDNAACESFMKTLKQEEIYCNQYAGFRRPLHASGKSSSTTTTTGCGCTRHWDIERRKSSSGTRLRRDIQSQLPDAAVMKYFTPPAATGRSRLITSPRLRQRTRRSALRNAQQGSGAKAKFALIPGNSPHDRPGKPGVFSIVKENLRTIPSPPLRPLFQIQNDTVRAQYAFSEAWRNLSVRWVVPTIKTKTLGPATEPPPAGSAPDPGQRTRREDHAPSHRPR